MMLSTKGEGRPEPALEDDLGRYLETTLHTTVRLKQWAEQSALPIFLTTLYQFRKAVIAKRQCLFMLANEGAETTPNEIAKHVGLVQARFDGVVVYVRPGLTSTERARLIEAGVPFIAPGNQLYIPQLAMDLRDYFRAPKKRRPDHLSPAAQAVYSTIFCIPIKMR